MPKRKGGTFSHKNLTTKEIVVELEKDEGTKLETTSIKCNLGEPK